MSDESVPQRKEDEETELEKLEDFAKKILAVPKDEASGRRPVRNEENA